MRKKMIYNFLKYLYLPQCLPHLPFQGRTSKFLSLYVYVLYYSICLSQLENSISAYFHYVLKCVCAELKVIKLTGWSDKI